MDTETIARFGRVLLWSLLLCTATGVVGRYALPEEIYVGLIRVMAGPYADQERVLATRPWTELIHRVVGIGLLVLGMLQFDPALRRRRPRMHRWSGVAFLAATLATAGSGLIFGLLQPFAGIPEQSFVLTVAALLMWFSAIACNSARLRQINRHREWMIRTLGLLFSIGVQRVYYVALVHLTNTGNTEVFILANWLALLTVLVAAETWISLTRVPQPASSFA